MIVVAVCLFFGLALLMEIVSTSICFERIRFFTAGAIAKLHFFLSIAADRCLLARGFGGICGAGSPGLFCARFFLFLRNNDIDSFDFNCTYYLIDRKSIATNIPLSNFNKLRFVPFQYRLIVILFY